MDIESLKGVEWQICIWTNLELSGSKWLISRERQREREDAQVPGGMYLSGDLKAYN